jgi:MoaA/NifB/PqqE/SkfB family radical SAM enzyme
MLRKDSFELLEYARRLTFCVKLKTNAILIPQPEAQRIRALGVDSVQVSFYAVVLLNFQRAESMRQDVKLAHYRGVEH